MEHLLLSIAVVIVVVRAGGWLLTRIGQPRVIGEILAGCLLGPVAIGSLWPSATDMLFSVDTVSAFRAIAALGLALFMFLIGLEVDMTALRGHGRKTMVVSQVSIWIPLALGIALGNLLFPHFTTSASKLSFCVFIGVAISITAFPVLARILQETGLLYTRIGAMSIACAAVGDVLAWLLLAGAVVVAGSAGLAALAVTSAMMVGYLLVMFGVVQPGLRRLSSPPLWLVLTVLCASSWATDAMGLHAIIGAFLAGAVMPRDAAWQRSVHVQIDPVVSVLILPVYFAVVGLNLEPGSISGWSDWGLLAAVLVTAVVGKLGAASVAARLMGERWSGALTLGVLLNTRGLTEIVILTVGLELGIIDQRLFAIMVVMALSTTVATAPLLRLLTRSKDVRAAGPKRGRLAPDSPPLRRHQVGAEPERRTAADRATGGRAGYPGQLHPPTG